MGKPVKKQNPEKSLQKKQRSLEREKQRSMDLTRAFSTLHKCLPDFVPPNLPKIKILRLAARYIEYLESILEPENLHSFRQQPTADNFFHTATKEIMTRNSYTEEIKREIGGPKSQKKESELTRLLGSPQNYPTPTPERLGSSSFSEGFSHVDQRNRSFLPEMSSFCLQKRVSSSTFPSPVGYSLWNPQVTSFGNLPPLQCTGLFEAFRGHNEDFEILPSIPSMSQVLPEIRQDSSQEWTFHDLSTVPYSA